MRTVIKIHGHKSTEEQITNEIHSLITGKGSRPYPLSVTETAKTLGVSRETIYQYIRKMKGSQAIQKTSSGKLLLPKESLESKFFRFSLSNPIASDPLVSEWIDDLTTRKGGLPVSSWRIRLGSLESVCNTCKIPPKNLIISEKNTEMILRQYAKMYRQGNASRDKRGARAPSDIRNVVYCKVQGVRDFCRYYGMNWPRGTRGIMSQKVPNHGKYSDIRLTEEELKKADEYIKEQFGIDSDVYRWFWIGIESCARFGALFQMSLDYTKHVSASYKTTYIMTAFETKTRHIKGGKWLKYITRSDTQTSIDLLKDRGSSRIYESALSKQRFHIMMSNQLKQVYSHLGKGEYFKSRPNHALRHIGAHYWLSKTDYNFGLIAEIGGWNTIDELKKSYGQIPPEKILEVIG
ncbi:helix-turn-helix domain-containing protein [Nitrosopumilus sp.]|uniref:helix-turn-helix domain-containing protein n=1 Tax=Nitrosopumilus sp. TaxID=2024843 RepID=UPI0034A04FB0